MAASHDHPIPAARRDELREILGLTATQGTKDTTQLYQPKGRDGGFTGREHQNLWYDTDMVEGVTGSRVPVGFKDLEASLAQGELQPRVYLATPKDGVRSSVSNNHFRTVAPHVTEDGKIQVVLMDSYGDAFTTEEQDRITAALKRKHPGAQIDCYYINKEGKPIKTTECAREDIAVLQHDKDRDNCGALASLACTTLAGERRDFDKDDVTVAFKVPNGTEINLEEGADSRQVSAIRRDQAQLLKEGGRAVPAGDHWTSPPGVYNAETLFKLIVDFLSGGETSLTDILTAIMSTPEEVRSSAMRRVDDPERFREAQERRTTTDKAPEKEARAESRKPARIGRPHGAAEGVAARDTELTAAVAQLREAVNVAEKTNSPDITTQVAAGVKAAEPMARL